MTTTDLPGTPHPAAPGLPNPRRMLAFLTVVTAVMMAVLDGSIVNVALPIIAAEQGVTPTQVVWVVTAYQLAVVVSLLPLAALGESLGFRKVYFGGLVLFTLSSLICATAPSLTVLSAGRILQGVGAAGLMSINGAMVRHIMPASHLGRGISTISLVVGISAAAGPSVAALILSVSSWHWLFLVNLPLGALILCSGFFTLPRTPASGRRFDVVSAILNALMFGCLISGLSTLGSLPLFAVGQLIVALVAGFLLARRERNRTSPVFPVDLLRIPEFARSVTASVFAFAAQFLALLSLPFFFHDILQRSELQTGLLMTPWPFAAALTALVAGYLADRFAPNGLCGFGMSALAAGLVLLAVMPENPSNMDIYWRMAVCGMGFGLFQSPNNRVMISSAPMARSGSASGMQSTARLFGQSVGAALAGLLLLSTAHYGISIAMWVAATSAMVAAILGGFRLRQC